MDMGAASDPNGPFRVPRQPAEGEGEAGGKGEDGSAPLFKVHGAHGAPTVRQIADGGQAAPLHTPVMFVVSTQTLGSSSPSSSIHVGAPGGAGRRCRQVLLAEDIQPRTVGAVPSVSIGGCQDVLGNQPAQRVECEVVGWVSRGGGAVQRGCARLQSGQACSWAMHWLKNRCIVSALPQPEVMPKARGVVVPDSFLADVAQVPWSLRMWGFTGGRPEERCRSWDNRVTFWECARFCAVQCGGWCGGSPPGVAVCQWVWLFAGLRWLVMDEEVVIHTVSLTGLLCYLCVQLDAVLQLCICPLDGGELHVTYCGFGFRGVVGDYPVEMEPLSTASLISGCRIRRRTFFAGGAVGPHLACCAIVFSGFHVARGLPP